MNNAERLQRRVEDALADALSAFAGDAKPEYAAWVRHLSPIIVEALRRRRAVGEFPEKMIDLLRGEAEEKAEALKIQAPSSTYRSAGDVALSVLITVPHFMSGMIL